MQKYTSELDFSVNTSLSIIAQRIKPNTSVLEFGPATGYMTRYLKEVLNCSIVAIELDPTSANIAKQYCEKMIVGNIDTYPWREELDGRSFDHIIFSDVLEHVYDPWSALKKATQLLKPNGTMLTSIPNVAHSAIIMNLINGEFDYQNLGLLDNTHIRFFTKKSIFSLLTNAGLTPTEWMQTRCSPSQSEFKVYYESFPPEMQNALKNRDGAEVYQYVNVSKRIEDVEKKMTIDDLRETQAEGFDVASLALWALDSNEKLLPQKFQVTLRGENNWTHYNLELNLDFNITMLGLSPSNQPALCEIKDLFLELNDGSKHKIPVEKIKTSQGFQIKSQDKNTLSFLSLGKAKINHFLYEKSSKKITCLKFQFKINRNITDVLNEMNSFFELIGPTESVLFSTVVENYSKTLELLTSNANKQQKELDTLINSPVAIGRAEVLAIRIIRKLKRFLS